MLTLRRGLNRYRIKKSFVYFVLKSNESKTKQKQININY